MSGKTIGIDFGEWKTCVCSFSGKEYNLFSDGNNNDSKNFFQPIVNYENGTGNILVSSQAINCQNSHHVSKRQCHDGQHTIGRSELETDVQYFLKGILNRCEGKLQVTITYPIEFTREEVERLRGIVKSVGSNTDTAHEEQYSALSVKFNIDTFHLIPDPVAAVFCYIADKKLSWKSSTGEYIVVDIGYTSTRVSRVEYRDFSAKVLSTEYVLGLSGEEISNQLLPMIKEDDKRAIDRINYTNRLRQAVEMIGWGSQSLDDIFSYSYEDENHECRELSWKLKDLDDSYLKPFITDHCFPAVDRLLNHERLMVLLVGGGSLLPSVRRHFNGKYLGLVYAKEYNPIASLAFGACKYRTY